MLVLLEPRRPRADRTFQRASLGSWDQSGGARGTRKLVWPLRELRGGVLGRRHGHPGKAHVLTCPPGSPASTRLVRCCSRLRCKGTEVSVLWRGRALRGHYPNSGLTASHNRTNHLCPSHRCTRGPTLLRPALHRPFHPRPCEGPGRPPGRWPRTHPHLGKHPQRGPLPAWSQRSRRAFLSQSQGLPITGKT